MTYRKATLRQEFSLEVAIEAIRLLRGTGVEPVDAPAEWSEGLKEELYESEEGEGGEA